MIDMHISRDYLNKLLLSEGMKTGTARYAAITKIIELLDENSLNGLLKSIEEDYQAAQKLIADAEDMNENWPYLREDYRRLERKRDELRDEVDSLKEERDEIKEEQERLKRENGLLEMLPAERSRVLAYEKALEIGMELLDENSTGAERAQVYRSASNVASGFVAKEDFKP